MDLQALRKLVRQGEGQRLEFKYKAKYPEKIIKEIVAFANTDGGVLLIGVGDGKEINGLKYADEDKYVLEKAIKKYCFPPISYEIQHLRVDPDNDSKNEREVLIFHIPKSDIPPHYIAEEEGSLERKVYIRVKDKSIQASKEIREILKFQHKNKTGVCFEYGKKEEILMQHLKEHTHITVDKFTEIASIPRRIASRTLIILVVAKVIRIIPEERQDTFIMRPT